MDVFTEDEAVRFLAERTGRIDEVGARLLAEEVGRLPLALAQAAWVIRQQGVSYRDYVQQLRTVVVGQELRPVRGEGYPHGAAEAVLLSLKQIGRGRAARLERGLLDLLSVLSPVGVPREWLYEAARRGLLGEIDGDAPARVDAALGRLAEPSLIDVSVDGSVGMDRFVQRVLRDAARMREQLGVVLTQAAALVESRRVPLERAALDRPEVEVFTEHAAALWANVGHPASDTPHELLKQVLSLQGWAGRCLAEAGDLSSAIPLFEQTLEDRTRVLGADHPDTLDSRNNLAGAYESAGRLDEAISLFEQIFKDRARVLGADHPDTLDSRHNLAYVYQAAGRLDEAIPQFEQTLNDSLRVLGTDDALTLVSRYNLAGAYRAAGRPDKAILLYEQFLYDSLRALGADHPDTQASRNNLAGAYEPAGRPDGAILLFEQELNGNQRVLGADHPCTLMSRNDLAGAYQAVGRLDEAILLYELNLNYCMRILGAEHPLTKRMAAHLATVRDSARS